MVLVKRFLMGRKELNQTKQKMNLVVIGHFECLLVIIAWVKALRIIPEFRILRLTFHRNSASKF